MIISHGVHAANQRCVTGNLGNAEKTDNAYDPVLFETIVAGFTRIAAQGTDPALLATPDDPITACMTPCVPVG
ncbi:hypothetical protein GCM10012275_42540 [Longimycelium tulufanense]|uniref:Uncharacterized protein n=1 Tax=Longimycelium tulufanense TaxID=907463 RepID=A0A8J3CIN6_9PSEU|nr:hypothetical protein GCM10012275_42540 [Longimycelium tulufanense]